MAAARSRERAGAARTRTYERFPDFRRRRLRRRRLPRRAGFGAPGAGRRDASGSPDAAAPGSSAAEARIGYDDFMKVDLRVAKVMAAERDPEVEEAAQAERRRGHRDAHDRRRPGASPTSPRRWSASTIAIVANLQPRKVMGIESNGMVLAGGGDADKPELVTFAEPPPPPGSRIR